MDLGPSANHTSSWSPADPAMGVSALHETMLDDRAHPISTSVKASRMQPCPNPHREDGVSSGNKFRGPGMGME